MAHKPEMPFDFDISRLVADMKIPGVDIDAIVASQKKNFEALNAANKMMYDGFQTMMKRQAEIMRQTVEDASSVSSNFSDVSNPGDQVARQTEFAKSVLESNLSNARELSEMMTKSQNEVLNLLSARVSQSLDEVKAMFDGGMKAMPTANGKAPKSSSKSSS